MNIAQLYINIDTRKNYEWRGYGFMNGDGLVSPKRISVNDRIFFKGS